MADRKSTIYDLEAEKIKEKIIIFAADTGGYTQKEVSLEIQASLDELTELIDTAGAEVVGRLVQNRDRIANDLYLGRGKVEELREMIYELGATGVCCDDELSPAQLMNLQDALDIKVMDRTMVILDIFAAHAGSYEGKLQVELAQLKYLLPRLTGKGEAMSRLGGGIGTRGPGETQLETDKRYIRSRIQKLRAELEEVRKVRAVQRRRRIKNDVPVVALVGYTNAGKSTLLNYLTGADIPANNRLFDTLDTTTRQLSLSDTCDVLLSDTVGFIAKLPHHLVEAFKATLEELQYADLLIHVIDASDPEREAHMQVVERLIGELAKPGVPVIDCYNKRDIAENGAPRGENNVEISARTGEGIDALKALAERLLERGLHHVRLCLPYSMGGMVDTLHSQAKVLSCRYEAEGILVEAIMDETLYGRLLPYVTE